MKNIIFKSMVLLCLFSVSVLRGQTPTKATTKTVEKEVKIIKTTEGGTTKTTKTTTTTSVKPATKSTTKKPTSAKTVIIKTNEEVVKVAPVEVPPPPPPAPIKGMPVMTFDIKLHDFGTIKMGDKPSITYNFTNTGDIPLNIDIVTGCDCTELDWTRTTVAPGEKGFISARYNSNKAEEDDHKKPLTKFVDIILKETHPSNGYPLVESLKFTVFIAD